MDTLEQEIQQKLDAAEERANAYGYAAEKLDTHRNEIEATLGIISGLRENDRKLVQSTLASIMQRLERVADAMDQEKDRQMVKVRELMEVRDAAKSR